MNNLLTLDVFMTKYATAPADRKQAALEAGFCVLDGAKTETEEQLYSLKEMTPLVGFHSYTSLSRLQVQRVGISYGGRLSYRLSDVRRYLLSDECATIRAELRRNRREMKGGTQVAASA